MALDLDFLQLLTVQVVLTCGRRPCQHEKPHTKGPRSKSATRRARPTIHYSVGGRFGEDRTWAEAPGRTVKVTYRSRTEKGLLTGNDWVATVI